MQGNRAEFYKQTIAKLISGLRSDDRAGRDAIYEKMRSTNEGYIDKNADRLSDAQMQSMRAELDQAIDEIEGAFVRLRTETPIDESVAPGNDIAEDAGLPDGLDEPIVMEDPLVMGDREQYARDIAAPPESTPPPIKTASASPAFWRERRFLTGLGAGLIVGSVVAFAAISAGAMAGIGQSGEAAKRQAAFETAFQATRELAQKEIELMGRIQAALLARQNADGPGLAEVAGSRYKNVADILPEFSDFREVVGDSSLFISIRADETDYKIRFNSPICATIRYIRPDLLDTRNPDEGIGCRFFGVWSEGGAKF